MNTKTRLLMAQASASNELVKYIKFMQKDIRAKNVAFPKACRGNCHSIHSLLESYNARDLACGFDPHKNHFIEVGGCSQLVKLMRQHEHSLMFKNEALLRTYPTSWFVKRFKKLCHNILPAELADVSFGQLYGTSEPDKVVDEVLLSDESEEVSPQVRVAIPTYASMKASDRLALRQKFDELAMSTGYYFSSAEDYTYEKHVGLNDKILVMFITYEAKYSYMDVGFNGDLYHVTSMRSLPKIQRYGLMPKSQSDEFSYPDRIFLFNGIDYRQILDYGCSKAMKKHDNEFAVLKILKANLVNHPLYKSGKLKFYRDPSYSSEDSAGTEQQAIFTYSNIPKGLVDDEVLVYGGNDGSIRTMKFR